MPGENLTRKEAQERSNLIQTHAYRVELDVTVSEEFFRSQTTVTFSATPGSETFIDLIARSVERITLNGEDVPLGNFSDSRIQLTGLAAENELFVDATCVFSHTGEGLHRAVDPADGEVYLYSQFEVPDCRRMFAVFEQPDLKAEFTLVATAPEQWKAFSVSPSPTPQPIGDGKAIFAFSPTERISSYLMCFIAGPYEGDTGSYTSRDGREIPMDVYARASLKEHLDGQEVIDITTAGMEFFEDAFDVDYPFRKYDQIFVPEFNAGAMEHPGCVTILDDYVFRNRPTEALVERRAVTILHELAHMWFGDLVTMKWWNDLWLNESFAEYMSHVATAEATRWTDAWVTFNTSEKQWAMAQDQLPSTHPIAAEIRDLQDVEVNFDGITYGKGAAVFQQLVAYVGWEPFIAGVSAYLKKQAWGNATLADLLSELSAASGRDLAEWSKLWLEEAGINTLTSVIDVDDSGVITSAAILQSSDGRASLRPHRIGVGSYNLRDGKLVREESVELDIDGEESAIESLIGKPRPDVVLINDRDLAYGKLRLDEKSFACATENINAFEDKLARTLVLASAWDQCRDAELASREYAELALRALETEEHGTVLRYTLAQLETATTVYSNPATRDQLHETVATRLFDIAAGTAAGSDRQLQITTSAIALAKSDEQLALIEGWLEGRDVPEGFAVDNNVRWAILRLLAAKGKVTEAQIERERTEKDNTASGAAGAARARAAISDAEVKERVWQDILGGKVPNTVQRYLTLGFQDGDPELLVPYVKLYFENVADQYANRSLETAQNMIGNTFPIKLVGREDLGVDVVALGEQWLSSNQDQPAALRRLVLEEVDRAKRAKNAQARDAAR